jgi:asparagine synthase (glutamine-hydrolysing)
MCGIAGIASKNSGLISGQRISSGISCLRHRGPEGQHTWINNEESISLAHSRLRIIDLSSEAAQPMHYMQRYTIVHNGELYNYIEIREHLRSKGYRFFTNSDTEVIAASFAAWGTECLQQFDGMFSFAIWDEEEKILFVARDRFGEKPLYFFYDDEQFAFGSEMKTLWSFGLAKEVNQSMLYNFITIGYTSNPTDPEETFYLNISKLPAANFILYKVQTHELKLERYWHVYPELNHDISEKEAIETFDNLFNESINRRLRSDVPVGTSLSGGLDSSAIVAFCNEQSSDQYSHKCFTAAFKGFEKNELEYAEMVAKQFGLEHYFVEVDENDISSLMHEVMQYQEEPFSSASVLAQYKVYECAKRNGVTVLLDGQGADEILGGYHKYFKWYWQELFRNGKLKKSGEIRSAKALGINEGFGLKNKIAALLPEFSAGILQSRKSKAAFHQPGLNRDFAFSHKRELYYSTPTRFDLNGVLFFNSFVYGLEELLRLADRNSMAHATEVRLPYLDHKLVEFLFTLPPAFKIKDGWTKWLLRRSAEKKLPKSIAWRKDKVGFEPPQELWMKNKKVQESIMEGKQKLVNNGILDRSVLKKIQPHTAYAAEGVDWKYWSSSFLF